MPVNVFGSGAVQTAYVAYSEINLISDLQLYWPFSYQDSPNLVTAVMDVINAADTNWAITLPKASEASVGQNFIIRNKGNADFNLFDHSGANIGIIAVGVSYYYYLSDNATDAGVWQSVTFGAGIAQADATDLAGNGLTPIAGLLNTNIPVVTTAGPHFIVNATERSNLIVWIGGSGTLTLPTIGSVPAGYYFAFNNEGSGVVTISGDATLDNITGTLVEIGQSLMIISDGEKWWSLGFGQQTFFSTSVLNKNVSGNTNVTLTANESDKNIIQFEGVLTGNIIVFFPVAANQWSIFNNTTGTYTLTIQLVGGTSLSYSVPQNNRQMFYSDGVELYDTPTVVSPSSITFPDGNVTNPGIAFTNAPNTGIYLTQPTAGENILNISSNGMNMASFINDGSSSAITFHSVDQFQVETDSGSFFSGSLNVSGVSNLNGKVTVPAGTVTAPALGLNNTTGLYFPSPSSLGISTSGSGAAEFTSSAISFYKPLLCTAGTSITPSISSFIATSAGIYFPVPGSIGFSSGGSNIFTIDVNGLTPGSPAIRQNTFNNLAPTTTAGDMIAYDGTNDVRVPASTIDNEVLLSRIGGIPVWGGLSVLQCLNFKMTTHQAYMSSTSSPTPTNLTLSITPTSANSKILVLANFYGCTSSLCCFTSLYRNTTSINVGSPIGSWFLIGSNYYPQAVPFTYLDSPNTTTPVSYTIYTGSTTPSINIFVNTSSTLAQTLESTITLIELGGF